MYEINNPHTIIYDEKVSYPKFMKSLIYLQASNDEDQSQIDLASHRHLKSFEYADR